MMIWQFNTFDYDESRRPEILAFMVGIKAHVRELGALQACCVDFGGGKAANIACYPDPPTADRALALAAGIYEEAEARGLVIPGSVEKRSGVALFDYLA